MSEWQPIETAPNDRLILLAVRSGDDRRTFVAERSIADKGDHWQITTGWTGWSKLHEGWEATHWMPPPPPPPVDPTS